MSPQLFNLLSPEDREHYEALQAAQIELGRAQRDLLLHAAQRAPKILHEFPADLLKAFPDCTDQERTGVLMMNRQEFVQLRAISTKIIVAAREYHGFVQEVTQRYRDALDAEE